MTTTTAVQIGTKHSTIYITLLVGFFLITGLSLNQNFIPKMGEPPLTLLISALISISLFFSAYLIKPWFSGTDP